MVVIGDAYVGVVRVGEEAEGRQNGESVLIPLWIIYGAQRGKGVGLFLSKSRVRI